MFTFDVISYGGGGFLVQVFNGVAMIFGNDDYLACLKMVALIGSTALLVVGALGGRGYDFRWFIIMLTIYMFFLVPKVDVNVIDELNKTGGAPTIQVVSNVPIGLAFVATMTSNFSRLMTSMSETVYSIPNGLQFSQSGPLFTVAITNEASKYVIRDPNLQTSMANFWKECVFYDLALGYYSLNDVLTQSDVMGFLYANTAVNRGFQYISPTGASSIQICKDSVAPGVGPLITDFNNEMAKGANALGVEGNNTAAWTGANQLAISQAANMPIAFQYLTNLSENSSQILAQSALANSLQDGVLAFGSAADTPAQISSYAATRAEAERNSTFMAMSKITAKMLPVMKNLIEGFLYMIFPIIGIWLIMPGGYKAGAAYIKALVWIALWAPLYAMLSFGSAWFTSVSAAKALMSCGTDYSACTPIYSMTSATQLSEVMTTHATIAGFMMASIPMIAWMIVQQGGAMAAGVIGRVLDGYQQPISHGSTEASAGNMTMGNTNMNNTTAFQQNTAPAQTSGFSRKDDGGFVETSSRMGTTVEERMSNTAIQATASQASQNVASEAVQRATSKVESTSSALAQSWAAAYRQGLIHSHGGSESDSTTGNRSQGLNFSDKTTSDHALQAAAEWAKEHGYSSREQDSFSANAAASLGIGKGGSGASVGAGGNVSHTSEVADSARSSDRSLITDQNREGVDKTFAVGHTTSNDHRIANEQKDSSDKGATLEQLTRADKAHQVALQELSSATSMAQHVQSQGSQLNINETNALVDKLQGIPNWKEGMNNLSREEHSDADSTVAVKAAITEFYAAHQQPDTADISSLTPAGSAATVRSEASDSSAALGKAARGSVSRDEIAFQKRVPQAGLEKQSEGVAKVAKVGDTLNEETEDAKLRDLHDHTGSESNLARDQVEQQQDGAHKGLLGVVEDIKSVVSPTSSGGDKGTDKSEQ